MRKFLIMTLTSFMLISCSTLSPLEMIKPKPSLEVNANVGKNVEQEKSGIKLEQGTKTVRQDAENISNDTQLNADTINQITNNMTSFQLALLWLSGLFIGWLLPDPIRCYTGVKIIVRDICHAFIVTPIKGFIGLFKSDK